MGHFIHKLVKILVSKLGQIMVYGCLQVEEGMVKKAEKCLEQDAQHLGQFEREIERGTDRANNSAVQEEREKCELSVQVMCVVIFYGKTFQ